ncbi:Ig-like domain repeat protein [Nocardioides daejeonensis]|uniref:Ig-like domain repeat protein n=1 Tax=Nocardioides daejeonensis TaxID=1046556 RepID=UPI000D74585E|nr:Ig-like domain repeat protein [Nocardioides daejeonensis]
MSHALLRRRRPALVIGSSIAALLLSGAFTAPIGAAPGAAAPDAVGGLPADGEQGGDPTLSLTGGETLEGEVTLSADPTFEGDSVEALTLRNAQGDVVSTFTAGDGARATKGTSYLDFDMGGNGTEAVFGNYITVNGHGEPDAEKGKRVYFPTIPGGELGTLAFPTEWLVEGDNTVTIHADGAPAYYGKKSDRPKVPEANWNQNPNGEGFWCVNKDDFNVSSLSVSTLGVVVDGEHNNFSYTLSDGICGDGGTGIDTVELTFLATAEPGLTRGLAVDLDTRTLTNGGYTLVARTASGHTKQAGFEVNNAPAGAARLRPADGTVVHGPQPLTAALPAGTSGVVSSLTIDGEPARNAETLAAGSSTFSFTVAAGNSIEARYHNQLLVNGRPISIGGDYGVAGDEAISIRVPNRYLVAGRNEIAVVTGDYNGTASCANRDDFKVFADSVLLTTSTGTVTAVDDVTSSGVVKTGTVGGRTTYNLGDGSCGDPATNMVDALFAFDIAGAETTRTIETAASGDAHLRMRVGGNGTDPGYGNQVLVNGIPVEFGVWKQQVADLAFPNEYLVPGVNVIEIVAGHNNGAANGSCDNYDDFLISNVELEPVEGEVTPLTRFVAGTTVTIGSSSYQPGDPITLYFGDGTCGSSHNNTLHAELRFDLTAAGGTSLPASGVRADVDSTTLSDGAHTVAATVTANGDDKVATRRFTVDNTAPVVESSVPAAGQRITSTVVLAVQMQDASGVASTSITLDGEPIENGAQIGHGLPAGQHTLKLDTVDSLGNRATRTVEFSSASIPEVPTDLTSTPDGDQAVLSSLVNGESGVDLKTTFTRADILLPTQGYQGKADSVPTQLDVAGDPVTKLRSLQPFDQRTIDTASAKGVVFQRYDIEIGEADEKPVLRWEGVIDPTRTASLRVWNLRSETWEVLTSGRGSETAATVLSAPVRAAYLDKGVVHVMVVGEDPFADDLSPRDASAKDDKDSFEDPADYDFAFSHFTDTQYLAEGAAGGTYDDWDGVAEESDVMQADEQAIWAAAYNATTQWIADNAEDRKIVYNAHTGDVIENDYYNPDAVDGSGNLLRPGLAEQVEREFDVTSQFHRVMDEAPLVNQVIAGNHDNQLGNETGPESRFSKTFSADRYYAAAQNWPAGASFHTWDEETAPDGSVTRPGRDSQNNYVLFSAGGLDFVAVGLSYGVTKEEVAWADSIFKRYKDRNGILLSHDYLKPSTAPDARGAGFSAPDGAFLYKNVVEKNANVFLVLAGHEHGVGTNVRANVAGGVSVHHNVVELLADYQFYTVPAGQLFPDKVDGDGNIDLNGDGRIDHVATERLQFGASFMRMLQFDVEESTVSVDTYSPYFKEFGATEYDIRPAGGQTKPRYNGAEDNMVLPIDLSTRKTSFQTDSLAVYLPTETIGEQTVQAGERAEVVWAGLTPGTSYGWLVTSATPDGGVATSEPAVLRTGQSAATVTADPVRVAYGQEAVVKVAVAAPGMTVNDGEVRVRSEGGLVGRAPVTGGIAEVEIAAGLQPGDHALSLEFTGSEVAQDATGTTTLTVERGGALLTAEAPTVEQGTPAKVSVRVDAAGLPTDGTVTVSKGDRELGKATLTDDVATVGLPADLAAGVHTLTVDFSGNDQVDAVSTTVDLLVTEASEPEPPSAVAGKVSAKPSKKKVVKKKAFKIAVQVKAKGATPTGPVQIVRNGKVVARGTLNLSGKVTLKVLAKGRVGKRTWTVRYLGDAHVRATSGKVTVKIVKRR